ncbi:MAG: hypothetical protein WBD36_13105 [Bacteroidota bacterium]
MKKLLPYFALLFFLSCDHGLELPPLIEPGFGGTIRFAQGTWPPATSDSLQNLWLFASQIYPLDSTNVLAGLTSNPPKIYVYPSLVENLPFFVDSVVYAIHVPPGTYRYIGVIQRYKPGLISDVSNYRIVGIVEDPTTPGQPRSIAVRDYEFSAGVDISVDFYHLPPQPF